MLRRLRLALLQKEKRALDENWFEILEHPLETSAGIDLGGARMLVTLGTVGGKRGCDTLIAHVRDGTVGDFGSAGIFEADRRNRSTLKDRIHDHLAELTKYGDVHEKSKGFGNDPWLKVKAEAGAWAPEARKFVEELIQLHKTRTGGKPGEILLFLSMGGHAYPGVFIAKELNRLLQGVPIFAVVNLPSNEHQRKTFFELKPYYDAAGVTGYLISDQMQPRPVTQDSVIGDMFAGFTSASVFSDLNTSFNNVAASIGNLVQFSYAFGEVVARKVEVAKGTVQHIVYRDEVKSETRRLVELLETSSGEVSVEGAIEPKPHQVYDLILLALKPEDVQRIHDDVEGAREIEDKEHKGQPRPHLRDRGNYTATYAPWVQAVDPDRPRCQIAVIRLRALRNDKGDMEELVKFPDMRMGLKPSSNGIVPATNGVVPVTLIDEY